MNAFFCDASPNEGQVVIKNEAGKWTVFTYNERTSKAGEKMYNNESDALEEFIKRLREDK
ncbi:Imm59 family immunity protein [Weizmannia coagulans]|uniref:Imm59 family immunity protein n=1 Tax=Heyndrickxia faecalis TaxID=2824910 RepID=A0ABV3NMN1_9BACI|nr:MULTISPECIES: Imm59 family immunity protein [Heyndrickxia]MCR4446159.1 Imm59 family immunity protein [Heyndrickxia coagulans]MCW8783913.1 Imm59 family immunity protein [Heyndrickxia coagulans]MDL4846554.1 Imm59 family immunity protein [Heyndrickxia coagulans]MED4866716.1 Imm59 family immunity protein [Weizmannia sp. CD-2023]MED4919942.1 Imm59 family immunity protein [Weizmannia sp. CD-2023]